MSLRKRPYQESGIIEIKNWYKAGKRKVLLQLPTGGGKTMMFCDILKAVYAKGTRALVAVRGVQLIQQASERLTREGVPHGIIQGSKTRGLHHPIQVCSIDTLYRRKECPHADFIVIDEAHQTGGAGYEWFLKQYTTARILAVSATPHLKGGMRHVADELVYPITVRELISQGYLVKPRYYAPTDPDMSGVKMSKGEFEEKSLAESMKKSAIIGKPEEHYVKLAAGRTALMFAVNVEHSKLLCERFNSIGIPTGHVDAKTPQIERQRQYDRLLSGEIKVLSNVGVLTTGFDCPPVSAIILCRPTTSYNLHIQIIGRGTRPFPGKNDFIVLDHAGNIKRHGFIEDEEPCDLDGKPRSTSSIPCKRCKQCYAVNPLTAKVCEQCGAVLVTEEPNEREVEEKAGELEEMNSDIEEWQLELDRLVWMAREKGLKKGWVYHTLKGRYGDEIADKAWNKIKVMKIWETKALNTQN